MKRLLICSLMILCAISLVAAQEIPSITVRNAHSMAVDPYSGDVFLFGGADEKRVFGDLWKLGDNGWEFITSDGPKPRTFAGMVFHEQRNSLILFGGEDALFGSDEDPPSSLSDTWEFKDGIWKEIELETAPPARSAAAMVYDARRGRIVLFGGYSQSNGKGDRLDDTWEFRGGKWKRIDSKGPSARVGAEVVYDSDRKTIVLFGGSTIERAYGEKSGETWVLNGSRWRRIETQQPPNIFNSEMVYDPLGKQIWRFGGWNGSGRIDETWIMKEDSWMRRGSATVPPARNHAGMVYDPDGRRALLFGGHDGENVFGDLWSFDGSRWSRLIDHPPVKRVSNGH
jgi:hypothetical protein